MAISIKIGSAAQEDADAAAEEKISLEISLNIRKTLDDNLIINDHDDFDIVIIPEKRKIVTFVKDKFGDNVYDSQDRFLKFLSLKGIVDRESIQGGNVYGSFEATIPESDYNFLQLSLLTISRFMEDEMAAMQFEKDFEEKQEEYLTSPDEEDSTEWDPAKYHDDDKGTIGKHMPFYGIPSVYRLEE